MDTKDIILIVATIGGWLFGFIQYFINRRNQKKDKVIEKRFEVYSDFMNKIDELNTSVRSNPDLIVGISEEVFTKIATGTPEESDQALIDFNNKLTDYVRNSTKSSIIINSELNKVQLVCSESLLPIINEYKALFNDFINEIQNTLASLSGNKDINITVLALQGLSNEERNNKFAELDKELKVLMRTEIGFYNK